MKLGLHWVKDCDVQRAVGLLKTNGVGSAKAVYVYPTVSLMSHSCVANLEVVNPPSRSIAFRVKRPVSVGEELTWSYTNVLQPQAATLSKHLDTWMFRCTCPRCDDPTELGLRYSQREEIKEEKVDDAILMAEVMAAGEGQLEGLVDRLREQGVHATHYIMVRLELRLMEMAVSASGSLSLLQRAVSIGPALVNTLRILDGEGCKLVAKYSSLLQLAEVRLETVMASAKDENLQPADAPPSGLGDEVRCVAFEPAHSASTVAKAEQLVGEKIESVIPDAAYNACKPGCGEEEKSKAEGWREQNCGILEAKVEGRVHLKIGGHNVEGNVEATLHG